MNEQFQFQLERWTGRKYVPHGQPQCMTLAKAYDGQLGETARKLGLPAWRVVRCDKDRPRGNPRAWRPTPSRACSRSVEEIRAEYLAWAAAAGLERVAVYARRDAANVMMQAHGLNLSSYTVDPADFLGPAPAAETIEEC